MTFHPITILVIACFLVSGSNAIQCFICQDKTANCVHGILTSCPPAAQFCKLEWTALTDMTVQSCATAVDCPTIQKRQAIAKTYFVGAEGSTIGDIANCCNYDGCNCVGTQCEGIGSGFRPYATGALIAAAIIAIMLI